MDPWQRAQSRDRKLTLLLVIFGAMTVILTALLVLPAYLGPFGAKQPESTAQPQPATTVSSDGATQGSATPTQAPSLGGPPSTSNSSTAQSSGSTPVVGTVSLIGQVATGLPGTLVGSGATITSALDTGRGRAAEYYGIRLTSGQTLTVSLMDLDCTVPACPYTSMEIATPNHGQLTDDWSSIGQGYQPMTGTSLAYEPGVFTIRISDHTMGSLHYYYTVTFKTSG